MRGVATLVRRLRSLDARHGSLPLVALAVVLVLSIAARAAWLGEPCRVPCHTASDRSLIFDETYYVNAARVIAGLRPPRGQPYAGAPAGLDPNAEHPQLAKLIIAESIETLGDGPLAWRLPSLLLGSLAILGLFVLARAAGAGRWTAVGACALMACDNLSLVHGRMGTLDVYALAAMVWGVALYLRGRPLLAGAVIGLGACTKLVALDALLVLGLVEGLRLVETRWSSSGARFSPAIGGPRAGLALGRAWARFGAAIRRLCASGASAAAVLVGLLAIMDRIAPPYDAGAGVRVAAGPFAHLAHMLSFAATQTSPHGPRGIASYPWQWIADYKPIVYLYINPGQPARGLGGIHPAVHFLGMISPPILLLALPALLLGARGRAAADDRAGLGLAWSIGTFAPLELLSLVAHRTSYLYYMVLVMPGVYVAVAQLIARARGRRHRQLAVIWACAVLLAVLGMYPFTPLP
ncbi:MAG: phospholipid carrier-dependent glycosyltransferase [Solirubrobacteraceae bacterium]